jgi:hypothetical protein
VSKQKKTGEGRDRPYSGEWRAAVKVEAQAALARARIRNAAARAARDEAKAARQRGSGGSVLKDTGTAVRSRGSNVTGQLRGDHAHD